MDDELITVAELAALLKVNQQTVRNWIDAGKIPHLQIGERRVRVWRSDLDRFLGALTAGHQVRLPDPEPGIWDGERLRLRTAVNRRRVLS